MRTELVVNVSCFEIIKFCNPETLEIFNELFVASGCNPFRIDCKFVVAEIGNEFVVIIFVLNLMIVVILRWLKYFDQ